MKAGAEILIPDICNPTGRRILDRLYESAGEAGISVTAVKEYTGGYDWLVMWGVGATGRSEIRHRHIQKGGRAILWDLGYFNRKKEGGACRPSIDDDYPTRWLDRTPGTPGRWESLGIKLGNNYDPDGHIVLAGIGPKQRAYMSPKLDRWESQKLAELQARFPGRRIVYRPKPNRKSPSLPVKTDATSPIQDVLKGAALAVCMHSNVAVDAVIAGVPFESEDGVSTWLRGKEYTPEVRLDFLRRLACWQWKPEELTDAWRFLSEVISGPV